MQSVLSQLQQMTTLVADTGDVDAIARLHPQDATTNPSLLLKAAQSERCAPLLEQAVAWARQQGAPHEQETLALACDQLAVQVGCAILQQIPGCISTEVDARFSFDTQASVARARRLIALYQAAGIDKARVLIKLAATWEGIRAAELLERDGIRCNLTLLFCFAQAQAAAEAGAYLISPFVGRILDWYKQHQPQGDYPAEQDPGVLSVRRIYDYYKSHGYPTIVMGASFRSVAQILALAGCDRLTISPALLDELANLTQPLTRRLEPQAGSAPRPAPLSEAAFRWQLNQDAMATDKLAEGIRLFAQDQIQLEALLQQQLAKNKL